ncbi:MAG: hypothetical protein JJU06_03885 [Ectothiorhodospiraceae bacterium]|nr:hypothetical protein [Ectothiorhodospiraceae bacterium]MCH8505989.1 hypothetical protein [Ectothiorhodospiraceae bacterium]
METAPIPDSYEAWKHCIKVECRQPLTADYVRERLSVWRDNSREETRRFRKRYGEEHLRKVITWFERAEAELS